nr:retrotransposable element Tf2 [Tanacetum cinerariifolium]
KRAKARDQCAKLEVQMGNGELRRKEKLVVGNDSALRTQLTASFHNEPVGGHYDIQRNKPNVKAYPGFLQPLPVPNQVWKDISMNFIDGLPSSHGKTVILVIVDRLNRTLTAREEVIQVLKFHLRRAQDRMKAIADKSMTDRQYEVNNWVYLKLQTYRQVTVRQGLYHKISSKFYGPFQVIERIGIVAYKLQLPMTVKIHPFFLVTQLKKCRSKEVTMDTFPTYNDDGLIVVEPVKILDRRMQKRGNGATVYVLVQWANRSTDDAT